SSTRWNADPSGTPGARASRTATEYGRDRPSAVPCSGCLASVLGDLPLPRVLARYPVFGKGGREAFEVLDGYVQGGDSEEPERDPLLEVDAHAATVATAERHVAVAKARPDADRRDPQPGTLDPPRCDVGHGGADAEEPEVGVQLVVEVHVGILPADPE